MWLIYNFFSVRRRVICTSPEKWQVHLHLLQWAGSLSLCLVTHGGPVSPLLKPFLQPPLVGVSYKCKRLIFKSINLWCMRDISSNVYTKHSVVWLEYNAKLRDIRSNIDQYTCIGVYSRAVCCRRADRMSASRRRRFRDVFTSCCTPAICC